MKAREYIYGLSHARLLSQLNYNKHTGHFTWRASIAKDKVSYHLGYFREPEDAYICRVIAELELYGDHAGCLRYTT